MTLKDTFKNVADTVFDVFSSIATTATFISAGIERYDPTTGATTATDLAYVVTVIFMEYNSVEKNNQYVLNTDQKAMIPVDYLTPTPKMDDHFLFGGVELQIVDILKDAAEAMYTFQVRTP